MNHTLYSVPIVVIPHNGFDSSEPANHQHTIWLSHRFSGDRAVYDFLHWLFWTESLDLFVNKTSMHNYIHSLLLL